MNPMLRDDNAPGINRVQRWELQQWFGRYPICLALLSLSLMASPAWGGTQIQWPIGNTTFQSYWPADSAWTKINALNDGDDGLTDTALEFVGDTTNSGFYVAKVSGPSNIKYLLFRIRVQYAGTVTQPTGTTPAAPFDRGSILVLIQKWTTNDTVKQPQWAFSWDFQSTDATQHGMEMQVLSSQGGSGSAWKNTKMDDVDGNGSAKNVPDFDNATRGGMSGTDAYIRTVDGQSTTSFGTTTFVDFAISCDYLTYVSDYTNNRGAYSGGTWTGAKVDLACGDNLYFQIGSISNVNDHGFLQYDIGAGQTPDSTVPTSTQKLPAGPIATYALVSGFHASVRSGRVVVAWSTQIEAGTLGFELERQNAMGEFEPVHEGLLSGYGPAGEGGSYRFVDPTALPGFMYTYRLTEVETNGSRREVGQYTVTPTAERRAARVEHTPLQPSPGDATFTPRRLDAAEQARLNARRTERTGAAEQGPMAATRSEAMAAATLASRAAIGVRSAGLYYVGAAELEQIAGWTAGSAADLIRSSQLRLTHHGKDIAWRPAGNGKGIQFYGEAPSSIYDPEKVYVVEEGPATLMATTRVPATGRLGPESFLSTIIAEENRFAGTVRAKSPEEDFWHWAMFNAASDCSDIALSCRSHQFHIEAPDPVAAGQARLLIKLRGNSSLPPAPDHHVVVLLNGTAIGEGRWDGLEDYALRLPFAASLLRADGSNTVEVQARLDEGVAYDYFYLDRFVLSYPRRYQARDGHLEARGSDRRLLTADGFQTGSIRVFDLAHPERPGLVTGAKIAPSAAGYKISFVPTRSTTSYLMVDAAAVKARSSLRAMQATGLKSRDAGAKYLVIVPAEFTAAAQKLVAFRSTQGLSGKVVTLQAIYDEFGAGQKTPHAIRRFLAYAARAWTDPPAYVLLGGKGTFDPKDYLGYGTDRLPVLMALTEAGVIAADQSFVDHNRDGLGDIAIGRLPAVTTAEFAAMVDKLIAHEASLVGHSRRVVLLADGPDAGGDYTVDSEAMAEQLLGAGYNEDDILRLHLGSMPATSTRTDLLAALNSGIRLLNYFGHSGVSALDHGLLTASDARTLTNKDELPLFAGMTCYMNRFEYPAMTTLGESLLLNPQGGAAAVWSSGGVSYNSEARELDEAFFKALFDSGETRVGDAVVKAASEHVKAGGSVAVPRVYNLLGDPALRWQP